jgi:hypothetical protein
MSGRIIQTDEGIITQDQQPVTDQEIADDELRTDGVLTVLHWVYHGQYTGYAIDVDVFIRRTTADQQPTVEDVLAVFNELDGIAKTEGIDRLTALVDVDDEVMEATGWERNTSLSLSMLNLFSSEEE